MGMNALFYIFALKVLCEYWCTTDKLIAIYLFFSTTFGTPFNFFYKESETAQLLNLWRKQVKWPHTMSGTKKFYSATIF